MSEIYKDDIVKISVTEVKQIGKCAKKNADKCNFEFGALCKFCSVWIERNIPRNCAWVRKA